MKNLNLELIDNFTKRNFLNAFVVDGKVCFQHGVQTEKSVKFWGRWNSFGYLAYRISNRADFVKFCREVLKIGLAEADVIAKKIINSDYSVTIKK